MGGALRCAALPFASPKQNEPAVLRPDCTEPRRYIGATLRVKLGRHVASDLPATRPAEQRSAQRTNRFSPASRRTFHTRTRMAAGTKNARRVPIGRRRMSRAEGGTDRRSSRPYSWVVRPMSAATIRSQTSCSECPIAVLLSAGTGRKRSVRFGEARHGNGRP